MKGHAKVIELLNDVLTAELTGINQYFVHAKMCKNWGYLQLAEKNRHESIDEMKHADAIIDRIIYLEGIPNVQRLNKINIGESVGEQFASDLVLENEAIDRLNNGIALCRDLGDNGSRELLESILVNEEEHYDWLETQIHLINTLGAQAYLAEKL